MNEDELIHGMSSTLTDASTVIDILNHTIDYERARADRWEKHFSDLWKRVDRFINYACEHPDSSAADCIREFIR